MDDNSFLTQYHAADEPAGGNRKKILISVSLGMVIILAVSGGMLIFSSKKAKKVPDSKPLQKIEQPVKPKVTDDPQKSTKNPTSKTIAGSVENDNQTSGNSNKSPANYSPDPDNPVSLLIETISRKVKSVFTSKKVTPTPKITDNSGTGNGSKQNGNAGPDSGGNSGGNNSGNSENGSASDNINTDDWKTIRDTTFGYTLKYPQNWYVKNTSTSDTVQATSFYVPEKPSEIIATFFIKISDNTNVSFKTGFKSSFHVASEGKVYIYQCVHILDDAIKKSCGKMVDGIVFDK